MWGVQWGEIGILCPSRTVFHDSTLQQTVHETDRTNVVVFALLPDGSEEHDVLQIGNIHVAILCQFL